MSAIVKILHPFQFLVAIESYEILPFSTAVVLATYLPWLEGVSAVALVVRNYRIAGGVVIISLLLLFIVAISMAMYRHLDIECGCFGTMFTEKVGITLLVRDFVLVGMVVNFLISHIRSEKPGGKDTMDL